MGTKIRNNPLFRCCKASSDTVWNVVFFIWKYSWIIALIVAIPTYIIMLNLFGFLTLPLYLLTPENKMKAKAFKAFQKGDFETGKALTDKFSKKFNVNVPEETSTDDGKGA